MATLIELEPETRAGTRLVACAESLAERLGGQAERDDTGGRYPVENVALLKQAGYFTAPIPEQFGGLGVDSVYDLLVASSRLARGDPSTTIGVNMHLLVVLNIAVAGHKTTTGWIERPARPHSIRAGKRTARSCGGCSALTRQPSGSAWLVILNI